MCSTYHLAFGSSAAIRSRAKRPIRRPHGRAAVYHQSVCDHRLPPASLDTFRTSAAAVDVTPRRDYDSNRSGQEGERSALGEQIRVVTFDGPGAPPTMNRV